MQEIARFGVFAQQYGWLLVFALSALGIGWAALTTAGLGSRLQWAIAVPLATALGMGLMIKVLFVLGLFGQINRTSVLGLLLAGFLGLGFCVLRSAAAFPTLAPRFRAARAALRRHWFWFALILAATASLPLRPLQVPQAWDELMYHLPMARFWADEGSLAVAEWLRFPLFAYNYNLLYTGALLVADDVFTHVLHMFAAALVALALVGAGLRWFDWRIGTLAALILLFSVKSSFGDAFIDLGVMLFLSFGFLSLAVASDTRDGRWLLLSGFFVALAIGTKYQALFFVPVYLALALLVERRMKWLALLALVMVVVASPWFLRNWIVSGDPIHPIGGPWFGFWLWNAEDRESLLGNFDALREIPDALLLLGLMAIVFLRGSSSVARGLFGASVAALAIWWFASGYTRYLVPVYALLALLSAFTLVRLGEVFASRWPVSRLNAAVNARRRRLLQAALLGLALAATLDSGRKYWEKIAPDSAAREAFIEDRFAAYAILQGKASDPDLWPVYQFGFEDQLYHIPGPFMGDWFGPARYRDVFSRSGDDRALAEHLAWLGARTILVNRELQPFAGLDLNPDRGYFQRVMATDRAELFRIAHPPAAGDPPEDHKHPAWPATLR